MWRTWRRKWRREEEEGEPSIWNWVTRRALDGFITQPGRLVLTLILGPKLCVMNISSDKWGNCNSWSIVGDTFAFQQIAVTPPGVWRQRSTEEEQRLRPHQLKLAGQTFVASHVQWKLYWCQMRLWFMNQFELKCKLEWLEAIHT